MDTSNTSSNTAADTANTAAVADTDVKSSKKDLHVAEVRDAHAGITKARSPEWPKVEHAYRKEHPVCECCGSNEHLNVHHKKPFHLYPQFELDPTNLITLCMDPAKECHIKLGHGDNFKDYNPNVEEDVKKVRENMTLFEETAIAAKKNRLTA